MINSVLLRVYLRRYCTFISGFPVLVLLVAPSLGYGAANSWIKTPTPDSSPDNVPPPIRSARSEFFDKGIGAASQLTPDSAAAVHLSEGSHFNVTGETPPEIPDAAARAVLTGTFIGYRSVLTSSRRSIYTEVNITVSHVFEAPERLAEGSTITLALPGGTVGTTNGTISYLTDPKAYSIEPNKRYLFVLSYHPKGDFYSLIATWNLSTGVVKPNSGAEQARAEAGESLLVGLTEDQLIPALNSLLSS